MLENDRVSTGNDGFFSEPCNSFSNIFNVLACASQDYIPIFNF